MTKKRTEALVEADQKGTMLFALMDILKTMDTRFKRLLAATFVLYFIMLSVTTAVYLNANTNRTALCALRIDLERRVESSQKFLIDHPRGIPGITPKVIRDGMSNQQRTIKALSNLSC